MANPPAVPPSPAEARAWAQVSTTSLSDDQLELIIDAEVQLQAEECSWDGEEAYPSALQQSLYRRVGRATAARALPLGVVGDTAGEYAPVRLPNYDVEISRYERRWRRPAFA